MSKRVAVLGASKNTEKFSNKAVRAYLKQGYTVYPVNPKEETIERLTAYASVLDIPDDLDRITVYLPPQVTLSVLNEIAEKGTKELFLNPGSESAEVVEKARSLGLDPILACSIIDIGETPKDY
ncbi:MAG: CoA-binding protein [Candidatus Latescibacterota bacterium]